MPFDSEDAFVPADPSQWPRIGGVPQIIVHPKPPPSDPASDGIDGWIAPGKAFRRPTG
jgi:hypothetical protein